MCKANVALVSFLLATASLAPMPSIGQSSDAVPLTAVEKPPRDFATAEEHYRFLLERADGGTKHTMATIPVWDGLWVPAGDTVTRLFLEGGTRRGGGTVKEGVLTPAYEAQFKARRQEIEDYGAQRYDRLTNCEYPGVPRWIREPYVKEFVNSPAQTWMFNDFMNESRRIYIAKEHVNIDARHSSTGDSIGFWDGDKLVVWTKWLNPADYFRGLPLTSNQFELVETWQQVVQPDGTRRLVTQATFYDPISLLAPQSVVYTHEAKPDLEDIGVRMGNWECATSSNSYKDAEGNTLFRLPGDPEYKDPRGFTDFPELPGQSLNPIFDSDDSASE
jgi:hypothetical protein